MDQDDSNTGAIIQLAPQVAGKNSAGSPLNKRRNSWKTSLRKSGRYGEYKVWQAMIQRCYSPKASYYDLYGGRGITVCQRWLDSFDAFYEDMGPRPPGKTANGISLYSIDRVDCNGPYTPENCRWADASTQCLNRRPYGRSVPVVVEEFAYRATESQRRWLAAIRRAQLGERLPTIRSIGAAAGVKSTNATLEMLDRLEKRGIIKMVPIDDPELPQRFSVTNRPTWIFPIEAARAALRVA